MRSSLPRLLLRYSQNQPMKLLAPTTACSAVATALCAVNYPSVALAWTIKPSYTKFSATSQRQFFTFLKSAVTPEEEVSSSPTVAALQPTGTSVADGTVVSYFAGGLAAVQVNDDLLSSNESNQSDDLIGRQVVFPNGAVGMVVAQRPPILFCFAGVDSSSSSFGDGKVQVLDSMAQVEISDGMSRMLDCFGRPFDDTITPTSNEQDTTSQRHFKKDIFGAIPQVADIALINSPMLTGETMIDALAPIGRGQNMLVVGSDLTDMRGLSSDFISTQLKEHSDTKCIYAVTHDRDSALERLKAAGVLEKTIVVSVRDNIEAPDPAAHAAEAVAVAATACAIGESFARDEGKNSLVIVDTIDEFKVLWDATTRVLVDVFGVDSVVQDDRNGGASSEMRAFYSSLIQRAGQFKQSRGGGSVTLTLLASIPSVGGTDETTIHEVSEFDDCSDKIKARLDILVKKNIPLTAANLRKIDIPIPSVTEGQKRLVLQHIDDLISMSDGQIWFDERLAEAGQKPPMDPQKSITRVGIGADTESRADAPAVRRMVEGLRLDLAQAASMDGAEANAASTKQTRKRNAWLLAMHQEPGQGGRTLAESCIALLAASTGALDETIDAGGLAGTEKGQSTMRKLIASVETAAPDAVREIDETLDISPARRTELVEAIEAFFSPS